MLCVLGATCALAGACLWRYKPGYTEVHTELELSDLVQSQASKPTRPKNRSSRRQQPSTWRSNDSFGGPRTAGPDSLTGLQTSEVKLESEAVHESDHMLPENTPDSCELMDLEPEQTGSSVIACNFGGVMTAGPGSKEFADGASFVHARQVS
eukprot:TRINITY_DN11944_c0_g1_i3.p1 TRINITY_DN11944_c0_g1~~TRINITY_DN11944_c0_g1_i3.p1  ORF type:complete len:152 (+),score=14.59 TRINITY_DN11944_c0_g1_i3:323-778(+)